MPCIADDRICNARHFILLKWMWQYEYAVIQVLPGEHTMIHAFSLRDQV